jgi:hypothetical protein
LLQPFSDDRFRFAASVARRPGGIDVGGVDGIETRIEKGVEKRERCFLIRGPAEDVAAEDERGNREAGTAKSAHFHGFAPCGWMKTSCDWEDCGKNIGQLAIE